MGKLTDKQCRAAKADAKDEFLGDGGGLYLRVRPGNGSAKVWLYRFKSLSGNSSRWFDIGTFPVIGLADAREQAAILAAKRRSGIDPIDEKKAAETEAKTIADVAAKESAAIAARLTVKQLFERWERLELKSRKDKGAEVRRSFEKDVLPDLGNVIAEDVKRSMIAASLDKVVERGSPVIARNLLGDLRQMFGFAIKREYVENDPTSHLKRDDFGKKNERDRVLNDEEIRALKKLLPNAGMKESGTIAMWVMLSTCCRVGEIIQARWDHIDLGAGVWRIPPDNAKNGKEHTVYLSAFSKQQFQAMRRIVEEAAMDKDGKQIAEVRDWVMPASHKDGHVCIKSLSKQVGDRQRGDAEPMTNRTKLTSALILPRGKWTPHDLRRTGATLMGRLGIRPDVIEKCLNHVEQNTLKRIYQRQELEAEQAEAWQLLGDRLELLISDTATNIVTLNIGGKAA